MFEALRAGKQVVVNLCDLPADALEALSKCGLAPDDKLRVRVAMDAMRAAELEHEAEEDWTLAHRRALTRERVRRHRARKRNHGPVGSE